MTSTSSNNVIISNKKLLLILTFAVLSILLAFIVGYFVRHSRKCTVNEQFPNRDTISDEDRKEVFNKIAENVSPENIRENLRFFAKKPHYASSDGTRRIAEKIHSLFESYNFKAEFHEYYPLLSFPDDDKPNYVRVVDESNKNIFECRRRERLYKGLEDTSDILPYYFAYGRNGDEKGDLVYANYGSKKDLEYLQKQNISLNGSILLVKDDEIGVGAQVKNAIQYGVVAILTFADPKYYSPGKKYPKGRWMPDDGVVRGSGLVGGPGTSYGDPLSKGYPSKDWSYKPPVNEYKGLADLPVQPIAASDAEILISMMSGVEVSSGWHAGFNITYRTGPLQNNSKLVLKLNNKPVRKKIRNVCGTIHGSIEPDRYVLLGNHIDAWVYGAVDASSGTSVMMEIARVLGEQMKTGWKPRRSIKMCGWDGEEFHLIGSVEFVEEFFSQLYDQAVAYINIDCAVAGNYSLKSAASPLLHEMMFEIHKSVEDPILGNMTIFSKSKLAYPDKYYPEEHRIYEMNADSDYFSFYKFIGIPSIDIEYLQVDFDKKYNTSFYPVYHSLYDTVDWLETFVDKNYKVHSAVAKVGLKYILYLSDLPLLPYDGIRYGDGMIRNVQKLVEKFNNTEVEGKETDQFVTSAKRFQVKMKELKECQKKVNTADPLQLRQFNDKMMQLEKKFAYPTGIPRNSQVKHYIMALSDDAVTRYPFPAISDLLPKINNSISQKELQKQISITTSLIQSAADIPCD